MVAPARTQPVASRAAGTACGDPGLAGEAAADCHSPAESLRLGLGAARGCVRADLRLRPEPPHEDRSLPGRDATDDDQGVGAHKDGGFLTLLLQDQNKGLQVEYDGAWIDVDPLPGTLVVNIGELLELASNGYLKATVHRVVTPPAGVTRYSVPFFVGAQHDATIPLLDLARRIARRSARPRKRSGESALPQCGRECPEEPLEIAPRRRPALLRRPSGIRTENRRGIAGNFWKAYSLMRWNYRKSAAVKV